MLKAVLCKYVLAFSAGQKSALQYRVNFFLSFLSTVFPIVIQTALWTCIYSTSTKTNLFGFNYSQMIIYTIIANIVSILMRTGCEYEISRDIKTGTLDRYLVKPIGYFSYRLGVFFGLKSIQLALMVILLFLSLGFFTVYLNMQIPIYNILGFMSSIITGFFITFLIFGCIGMSSFWFTEVGFLFEAARIIIITLSGGIFPLSVFGPEVQAVLDLLPFQLTTQFPTQLLCGNLSNIVILKKIAFSFIWIAMLSFILKGIWYFGLRKYHAVGS